MYWYSNSDRKIGNVVVLKEYHYIVNVLLLVVGSLCGDLILSFASMRTGWYFKEVCLRN